MRTLKFNFQLPCTHESNSVERIENDEITRQNNLAQNNNKEEVFTSFLKKHFKKSIKDIMNELRYIKPFLELKLEVHCSEISQNEKQY